jgi:hypothetical protein
MTTSRWKSVVAKAPILALVSSAAASCAVASGTRSPVTLGTVVVL